MAQTPLFLIRVTPRTLSFAVKDGDEAMVDYEAYEMKAGMSVATNLREAFTKSRLLRTAPTEVTVIIDSPVLLLPMEDYSNDVAEQYKYVYPDLGNIVLRHTPLPMQSAMAVFSLSRDLGVVLGDHFREVHIEPLYGALWQYFGRRHEERNTKKMYAYYHDNKVAVWSFHRRRFVFANTFTIESSKDAVYYLLGAWKNINAKGASDDLILAGLIPDEAATIADIKNYISSIETLSNAEEFPTVPAAKIKSMPLDMLVHFIDERL